MDYVKPAQKLRAESGDRRGQTFHYHFKIDNKRIEVCREMFCNTFSIGVWSARKWAKIECDEMRNAATDEERVVRNKNNMELNVDEMIHQDEVNSSLKITNATKEFTKEFIKSLPKVESHYCRKDTSKMYLETTFQLLQDLYRLYVKKSDEAGYKALSRFTFNEILKEMNVSLFQPKKDQCDICCQYKLKNIPEEVYVKHVRAKERAREEKSKDKDLMEGLVLSVDVQAVKLAPFVQASALYFKTKLCYHNYTIFNLKTQEVDCYWWTEVEGELKASIFTSLLYNHIKQVINT